MYVLCNAGLSKYLAYFTYIFQFFLYIFCLQVGIPGIFGNLLSVFVLTLRSMRNVFHTLLVVLAIVDSILIGFTIMDYSIVRGFDLHFNLYGKIFPYFIYPVNNIVMTTSIFIVVAIAYERYVAVCKPYHYRYV